MLVQAGLEVNPPNGLPHHHRPGADRRLVSTVLGAVLKLNTNGGQRGPTLFKSNDV